MEVFLVISGLLIGAAAGFYFGRSSSSETKEKGRLEAELREKQAELEGFRTKVNSHFEKTADLFNQVSDSYQSLYDHMAHSSNHLCASPTFQSLPKSATANSETLPNPVHSTDKENLFDANNLYNAHDYRNQSQEKEIDTPDIEANDKVVDIESVKEEKKMPPLDYAIKEEGTINHNSLETPKTKLS